MFWRPTGKLRSEVVKSLSQELGIHCTLKLGLDPKNNQGVTAVLQQKRESDQHLRRLTHSSVESGLAGVRLIRKAS